MIKIPPAILSDGLAKHELNQLINMENLLAHIVNRHGQNFLSVTGVLMAFLLILTGRTPKNAADVTFGNSM